jgi:hypothetical protein
MNRQEFKEIYSKKEFLGEDVNIYYDCDSFHMVLSTDTFEEADPEVIYLSDEVLSKLMKYCEKFLKDQATIE